MFDRDTTENSKSTVEIKDITYEIFMELLRYIYTGKVSRLAGKAKNLYFPADKYNMQEFYTRKVHKFRSVAENLFIAADKYDLRELMTACVTCLCDTLSIRNAVDRLKFADNYNVDRLKKCAIDFIVKHGNDIVTGPGFKSLLELHKDVALEIVGRFAKQG